MIKMLLFDLDDTLLNSNKIVTDRTRKALWNAHDKGIKIGYDTARTIWSAKGLFDGLPFDAVAYCSGATVYCDNKLVFESSIPGDAGKSILNNFLKVFPGKRYFSVFEPYSHVTGEKLWKDGKPCDENEADEIGKHGYQRIVLLDTSLNDFKDYIDDTHKFENTRYGGLAVTPPKVSKGHAAQFIAKYFNIDMDEVASFGDDMSDFSMLRVSGVGVAMKNAVYETKSVADCITDSHNKDGVAKWIEKHIL